jgi:hypothetical protein
MIFYSHALDLLCPGLNSPKRAVAGRARPYIAFKHPYEREKVNYGKRRARLTAPRARPGPRVFDLIIPHHETFSTTIQPPYSYTKGYRPGPRVFDLEPDAQQIPPTARAPACATVAPSFSSWPGGEAARLAPADGRAAAGCPGGTS